MLIQKSKKLEKKQNYSFFAVFVTKLFVKRSFFQRFNIPFFFFLRQKFPFTIPRIIQVTSFSDIKIAILIPLDLLF